LKMKLLSVAFFSVTALITVLVPSVGLPLPFFFGTVFGAYGIVRSLARHLDPLNDVPNAFRVFLASLGGLLLAQARGFVFPSAGILLLAGALFLNDEYQRRALHALRTGRRGGSVALLGIDGSGKSSHAIVTRKWLEGRGYTCTVMPFHRYLFVERLAAISSAARGAGSGGDRYRYRKGGNRLRPVLSLVDNLILQLTSSIGCRLEGRVVIYDRFIWSTYVKYKALGYPVKLVSALYLSPRPTFAIVLEVPVDKSLRVIDERVSHIHYPKEVLESEQGQYLEIARRNAYPVIQAIAPFEEVQEKIQSRLSVLFPVAGRGRSLVDG
jgi:thymidylate kinase